MRFKIDENLPVEIADLLIQAGHEADIVLTEGLGGTADPQISLACQREGRVLVTLDLDFADIRFYPPGALPSTVVMRLNSQDKPSLLRVFAQLLPDLYESQLAGNLWIVEEDRVRIREGTAD